MSVHNISLDNGTTYQSIDEVDAASLELCWSQLCEVTDAPTLDKAYDAAYPLDSDTDEGRRAVLAYVLDHGTCDLVIG